MAKYDLTTEWTEVYNSVDQDRDVLFSGGAPDATRRGIYLSLGRNKEEDVLLCLQGSCMFHHIIKAGTSVHAKMTEGTAIMCVCRC